MQEILSKTAILIPARKGSKGIWNKNLRPVLGRPMISYCLEAAVRTGIEEIHVLTDDERTARLAESVGARAIMRSPLNALSSSPSVDGVFEALGHIKTPKYIVLVQPTSPMTTETDILETLSKLHQGGFDTVFTASKAHFKIWCESKGELQPTNHTKKTRKTRQDSEPSIIENGAVYATRYDSLKKNGVLISGKVGYVEVPRIRSFEIDDYQDIHIVEAIMSYEKSLFDI